MEQPDEVNLRRQEGAALIKRLRGDALTAQDRRVLEQVRRWYFWLLFALQEARCSLKRLRAMVFGDRTKKRPQKPSAGDVSAGGGGAGGPEAAPVEVPGGQGDPTHTPSAPGARRSGPGRWGAQAYSGATHVVCHHETLASGERWPVGGRGRLYRVAPGVAVRLDGHAVRSAVRYALEQLRCSACGQGFTAAAPAGAEQYSARARAVLVLGRYDLGVPLYRLEGDQAMVGVPVSDATPWDQIERVARCAQPVFAHLQALAAQGEVSYQDDTHVRILSLSAANRQAQADGISGARTGMYTTALVAQQGAQTICLYVAGRAQAGENRAALWTQREAGLGKPLVMSAALASHTADAGARIRCHCLAHGRRTFSELEETLPAECPVVSDALQQGFDHDEEAHRQQMSALERLAQHPLYSRPIMERLKCGLDQPCAERLVEPHSSLGKAFQYLLTHWQTLTRCLAVPGAPLENNTAERVLQLAIRQRQNRLFYATDSSASIASMLPSRMATCLHAGTKALDYLVAVQEHRAAVLGDPAIWLP